MRFLCILAWISWCSVLKTSSKIRNVPRFGLVTMKKDPTGVEEAIIDDVAAEGKSVNVLTKRSEE